MKFGKIFAGALLALSALVVFPCNARAEERTAAEGIYIDNICVSGMNETQINEVVEEKLNQREQDLISLCAGDSSLEVNAGELGVEIANYDIAGEAIDFGRRGNILYRYSQSKKVQTEGIEILDLYYTVDEECVQRVVEEQCVGLDTEPVNPSIQIAEDGSFYPTEGKNGFNVDTKASIQNIMNFFNQEWNGGNCSVALATTEIPYNDSADFSKVTDVLGTGTTSFTGGDSPRNTNIAVGVSRLNGTTVLPGEELSVCTKMGPYTEESGYSNAASYLEGEVVDSLGGGICQVSTTLFQGLLNAELEITERSSHSMSVGYVPASMDAAIEEGIKDLCFVNNTDAPIYIQGYCDTEEGIIEFTIWGHETRDPSRSISFESKVLQATLAGYSFKLDENLPFGSVEGSAGKQGCEAEAIKIIYENGVEVDREDITSSEYRMKNNEFTIGIAGATDDQIGALQSAVSTGDKDTVESTLNSLGVSCSFGDISTAFTADGQMTMAIAPEAFLQSQEPEGSGFGVTSGGGSSSSDDEEEGSEDSGEEYDYDSDDEE